MEIFTAESLRKRYADGGGIDGINMHIVKNTIHGFLGLNGAGKTTTMKCIMGILKADSGRMIYLGEPYDPSRIDDRKKIGFSPELPSFPPYLTGREALYLYGRIRGLGRDRSLEDSKRLLDEVDLQSSADKKIGKYSRGMIAKLGIAAALLGNPDLIILDEPTSGIDPSGAIGIRNLFRELMKNGLTILLSSHLLFEVQNICDNVTIINNGHTIAEGSTADIISLSRKKTVYLAEFSSVNPDLLCNLNSITGIEECSEIIGRKNALKIVSSNSRDIREEIARAATENSSVMLTCNIEEPLLEEAFLRIISSDREVKDDE